MISVLIMANSEAQSNIESADLAQDACPGAVVEQVAPTIAGLVIKAQRVLLCKVIRNLI